MDLSSPAPRSLREPRRRRPPRRPDRCRPDVSAAGAVGGGGRRQPRLRVRRRLRVSQNAGWNHDRPSASYWSYGPHNLSHQYGTHRIFNNQYGGARVEACYGFDGRGGGTLLLGTGVATDYNLTPVNSLVLLPKSGTGCRR